MLKLGAHLPKSLNSTQPRYEASSVVASFLATFDVSHVGVSQDDIRYFGSKFGSGSKALKVRAVVARPIPKTFQMTIVECTMSQILELSFIAWYWSETSWNQLESSALVSSDGPNHATSTPRRGCRLFDG
eukprot:6458063-Amphidinium_carterae.3